MSEERNVLGKARLSFMPVVLLAVAAVALPNNASAEDPSSTTITPSVAGYTVSRVKETSSKPVANPSVPKIRPRCGFTRTGTFDPMVYPGVSVSGHHHTFFGNDAVNPNSTSDSLKNTGGSTCAGGTANRSAYWIPSMYDSRTGAVKVPSQFLVYYAATTNSTVRAALQPIPEGLKMIAGDHTNTSPTGLLQTSNQVSFFCSDPKNGSYGSGKTIPTCMTGATVRYKLSFPNCWNGKDLDSANHMSHLAYSRTGNWKKDTNECPTTHPVRIPSIMFVVDYKINVDNESAYWRLSSDMYAPTQPGGLSIHGDIMSAWDPKIMKMMVNNCLKGNKDCSGGLLGADDNGKYWTLY
jgi:Domain of unknown function (DUF1996)